MRARAATNPSAMISTPPSEPRRGMTWLLSKAARRGCSPPTVAVAGLMRSSPAIDGRDPRPAPRPLSQVPEAVAGSKGRSKSNPALIARHRPAQPHHVADHLGHGLVVFRRDRLVDFHRRVQRPGERRILDERDGMFLRHLADLPRQ